MERSLSGPNAPHPPVPRSRRLPRGWKISFALGGVVLAVAVALLYAHYRLKSRLEDYRQQLRAQGEKLSAAELLQPFSSETANGAGELRQILARLPTVPYPLLPFTMKQLPSGHARVTWQQTILPTDESTNIWPQLREHISATRDLLVQAHAAVGFPALDFAPNLEAGTNLQLPHLAPMKSMAQSLSAAAILNLRDGDPTVALAHVQAMARIAARWNEPIMISQLVRVAVLAIAVGPTWELLQHPELGEEDLARLQADWQQVHIAVSLPEALAGERAYALPFFSQARRSVEALNVFTTGMGVTGGGSSWNGELTSLAKMGIEKLRTTSIRVAWPWWWSYEDELWYLRYSQNAMDTTRMALGQDNFALAAARFNSIEDNFIQNLSSRYLLSSLLVPSTAKFCEKLASGETQARLVTTAIALERYRIRHGEYPENLAALVPDLLPAVPVDFMDGQPLRYERQPDAGFRLYSVGQDSTDNGGDSLPPEGSGHWLRSADWVWPLPASQPEIDAYHEELKEKREQRKRR